MNKLKFLPLLAFVFLVNNAFALSGHGFKVISEKIESSPGAVGGFRPATVSSPGFALAWAMAYDADGRVNENVQVSGAHTFAIKNDTGIDQVYSYKMEINCDGQYIRKTDKVLLSPGGRIDDGGISYLNTYHTKTGNYQINAVTTINGESSHQYVGTGVLNLTQ